MNLPCRPGSALLKANAAILLVGTLLVAGTSFAAQSRIYEDYVPAGALHLGQVIDAAKRDQILKTKALYEAVKATGADDADIVDGSVVAARIFCCGGITKALSSEVSNSLFLYVPKGLDVGLGDIVELRVGHPAEGGNLAVMNSVTRIVQKSGKEDGTLLVGPQERSPLAAHPLLSMDA